MSYEYPYIEARITYVDTINRFATALMRHQGQTLCAEFIRIEGEHYDHLEKKFGLGHFMGESFYD